MILIDKRIVRTQTIVQKYSVDKGAQGKHFVNILRREHPTRAPDRFEKNRVCQQLLFAYQGHGAHSWSEFLVASGATLVFNATNQV